MKKHQLIIPTLLAGLIGLPSLARAQHYSFNVTPNW